MNTQRYFFGALLGLATLIGLWAPAIAYANQSVTSDEMSHRMSSRLGVYTGVFNDPAPSILSLNAAYNLTDYMRLTAGVGRLSVSVLDAQASVTTLGVGAKAMVPGWSLTPTLGVHGATVIYSGTSGMVSVGGVNGSTTHLYVSAGFDWQAKNGFNLGMGVNQSLNSQIGTSTYLSLGWFFDLSS